MNEQKKWYERSALRAFAGTLLLTVIAAWAAGDDVVESLRQNANALGSLLVTGLGLTFATKSSKAA